MSELEVASQLDKGCGFDSGALLCGVSMLQTCVHGVSPCHMLYKARVFCHLVGKELRV